jgi:hypothetical protein
MRTLRILVSVITLFTIHNCFAQQPKNDWEKENLKGRVKSLMELRTYDKDSVSEKRWLNKPIVYVFNESGNFVLCKRLTLIENSIDSTVYFYDSKDRLSRILTYGKKRRIRDSINYSYFEDGSKVEHFIWFMYSPTAETVLHTYDPKGNLIHNVVRNIDTANSKGNDDVAIENQYNKRGWLIKTIESRKGGVVFNVATYRYDKEGKKKESFHYDNENSKKPHWSYKYNKAGLFTEWKYYLNNGDLHYLKRVFNVYNDQIEQIGLDANKKVTSKSTVEYEYDSQHNWTKETWYHGNEVKSIRARTIEYY